MAKYTNTNTQIHKYVHLSPNLHIHYVQLSTSLHERDHKVAGHLTCMGCPAKKLYHHLKGFRGQILTDDTRCHSLGTPRKSGFSERKRPKEGERVVLGHFHERVI